MNQDYNYYNYDRNYDRNERQNSPPNRPRWQNGGYFPYNNPQRRPGHGAHPGEIRTPPGLSRQPSREASPQRGGYAAPTAPPVPPVALESRPEYHGSPVPDYHIPAQPEPRRERYAPSREQYVYVNQPKRRGVVLLVICLVLLCALIAGGVGAAVSQMILRDWEAVHMSGPEAGEVIPTPDAPPRPGGILTATEISELGRLQVVSIRAEVSGVDSFGRPTTRLATGTGFIISAEGYILTNYHVIEDADGIVISMEDGREFAATVLGGEFVTSDVAVLKIEAEELFPVTIGNSAALRVGESIFAIGNPLELYHSISSGIVSALDREVSLEQGQTISMFQIDASVNRGNSGGPVYNERGEVVGIVTAKASIDGVEGIGFAIPIEDAMRHAQRIIAREPGQEQESGGQDTTQDNQPWLGISPITVPAEHAEEFGLVPGVFVNSVYANTAAERAGLQMGDVIVAFGGTPVTTVEELRDAIARYVVGDTVNLLVWRDGDTRQVSLTLAARPAEQ